MDSVERETSRRKELTLNFSLLLNMWESPNAFCTLQQKFTNLGQANKIIGFFEVLRKEYFLCDYGFFRIEEG